MEQSNNNSTITKNKQRYNNKKNKQQYNNKNKQKEEVWMKQLIGWTETKSKWLVIIATL